MPEDLLADPQHLAGLSKAMEEIANDGYRIVTLTREHCPVSAAGFGGEVFQPLLQPFTLAAEATSNRLSGISGANLSTSTELNNAAWLYHEQDKQTYEALNAATIDMHTGQPVAVDSGFENPGVVKDYYASIWYGKPNIIKTDPPSAAPPELADLISETTGVLGDVNDAIKDVTRMAGEEINILETVLNPITVNWNELRRIGETYKVAGNGMEALAANLEDGLSKVGPNWNGQAAIAFEDWARPQIAAMKWEGPTGRVICDLFNVISDRIRECIRTACEKLKDMIVSMVEFRSVKDVLKFVAKKIPVIGTIAEAIDLSTKIWKVVDMVLDIKREIEHLRDRITELLQFVTDPVGKGKEWVQQKMEPVTGAVADAAKKAALVNDINSIAHAEDTLNRPKDSYEIGSGQQPWQAAT
ncbi:hypothetical protein [Nocardia sp. NPDC051750]|uniref:hypothetical protein n=1 Tax=Nocardia sp. NPDC051750 TaxID=3364325 RepID=UPI00379ED206